MISREDDALDGLEFEEMYPHLTVVRDEPAAEPAPQPAVAPDRFDELVKRIDSALTAALDQRIEQRLATFRAEIDRAFTSRTDQPAAATSPDTRELPDAVSEAIRTAASARDVARALRDAVHGLAATAVFALAVHHPQDDEVVYRYRAAASEALGARVREGIDDGPDGAAAHADGWLRAHRTVRVGPRNVTVHTAQCAIRSGDHGIGVLTLQTEKMVLSEPVLTRVAALLATAAPRLAELRDADALRGA